MTGADELTALAGRASRDDVAMTEFVQRTQRVVWRTCASLVDPASADDLAQDTFARVVRALPGFRGESSAVTWVTSIARRVCADEIARRQRARALEVRLQRVRPVDRDPTALVDLTDALDRLPPPRREAFLLTAVAGVGYADAARACGCSIGTIRSRVSRARDDLARAMGDGRAERGQRPASRGGPPMEASHAL